MQGPAWYVFFMTVCMLQQGGSLTGSGGWRGGGSVPWLGTQETIGNGLLPTIVNYASALLPLSLPFLSLVGGDIFSTVSPLDERVFDTAYKTNSLNPFNHVLLLSPPLGTRICTVLLFL